MTEKAKEIGREPVFPTDNPYLYYMNKREYFSAMAMQGYCANESALDVEDSLIAIWSAKQADALLEELAKEQ